MARKKKCDKAILYFQPTVLKQRNALCFWLTYITKYELMNVIVFEKGITRKKYRKTEINERELMYNDLAPSYYPPILEII